MNNQFRYQGGRRFAGDPTLPYPLPVDLEELHRQSLKLVLLVQLWGAPFCNKVWRKERAPTKVLEVACGTALWSSTTADYFKRRGFNDISFTGVDIVSVAPDLQKNGVNWKFVQHDLRNPPFPFPDEEFDFIFIKDVAFCVSNTTLKGTPLQETTRMLKPGGVAELWESDHLVRTLLPNPTIPIGTTSEEIEQAKKCGAYIVTSETAFAASQNPFFVEYNAWVENALGKRNLTALPCSVALWAFHIDAESFSEVGSRRLALPLGETRWEREADKEPLTPYRVSLRSTALLTTMQFIESMEPILKAESGKLNQEWDRWWSNMRSNLLKENGASNGECLEIGAWWARKHENK